MLTVRRLDAGGGRDPFCFLRHDLHDSDRSRVGNHGRLESAFLPNDGRDQIRINLPPLGLGADGFPILEWKQDLPETMRHANSAVADEGPELALQKDDRLEGLAGGGVQVSELEGDAGVLGMGGRYRFHLHSRFAIEGQPGQFSYRIQPRLIRIRNFCIDVREKIAVRNLQRSDDGFAQDLASADAVVAVRIGSEQHVERCIALVGATSPLVNFRGPEEHVAAVVAVGESLRVAIEDAQSVVVLFRQNVGPAERPEVFTFWS